MNDNVFPAESKVLVYDCSTEYESSIKQFCTKNHLMAVKPVTANILDVLRSFVDLGAIFLSEDIENDVGGGIKLGHEIHRIRPELPIILRSCSAKTNPDLHQNTHKDFCAVYNIENIDAIQQALEEHIFCKEYPNALVRGIEEITSGALRHFFNDVDIESSTPYIVKDRIIFGELFSLMPVESYWCKGYMMLQLEEANVRYMVDAEKISSEDTDEENFRVINDVLSEITNMTWGGIKARFISDENPLSEIATQIPIVINHKNRYITFGTNTPQLCFKYTIKQKTGDKKSFVLYHKFVFNLYWKPERFSENQPSVHDLVDAGELDFF